MELKTLKCTNCGSVKPWERFSFAKKGKFASQCKDCVKEKKKLKNTSKKKRMHPWSEFRFKNMI
jgi:hypothetical protein